METQQHTCPRLVKFFHVKSVAFLLKVVPSLLIICLKILIIDQIKQIDPIVKNHITRGGASDRKMGNLSGLLDSKLLVIAMLLAAKKKRDPPTEACRSLLATK